MNKEFLALIVAVALPIFGIVSIQPQPGWTEFEQFKREHGKSYADAAEEEYRRSIFHMNLA